MAEIFSDEGLNLLFGVFPKNGANFASLFVGLFSSQTPTTVPAGSAVMSSQTGITELAAANGYARQAVAAGAWSAISSGGGGRQISAPVTFTASGLWVAANGFFIASTAGQGSGVGICYANFDSGLARLLQSGDSLTVTATMTFLP